VTSTDSKPAAPAATAPTAKAQPAPMPVARRVPVERVHHGDVFVDDYEWLRDKGSPETLSHLEAENAYTEARTAHLAPLREQLFEELRART
jgi:oligopeptidase B